MQGNAETSRRPAAAPAAAGAPEPSRRDLLRAAAALGGGLAAATMAACNAPEQGAGSPRKAEMAYRTLGRTGLKISEVGVGGFPIDDPDLVLFALDQGINYLDTAHCYRGGASERAIGQALRGRRDKFVVTTKWCPHHIGRPATKDSFLFMLDESLRRLQTDHVDIVINHSVGARGGGIERLQNPELHEAFEAARQAGKVRFMGVSGHGSDLMQMMHHAVDSGLFDVLLCRYSFLDFPEQDRLIEKAHAKGVGFIAMKTLAGAKGQDLDRFRDRYTSFRQAALKWVLSNHKVSGLIVSMNHRRQIEEYAAASGPAFGAEDQAALREYGEAFSSEVCRYCGACEAACPDDVRIADILRFSMYHREYRQEGRALEAYAGLVSAERAAHCTWCRGHCEQACAYDLPIRTLLLDAHTRLDRGVHTEDPSAGVG